MRHLFRYILAWIAFIIHRIYFLPSDIHQLRVSRRKARRLQKQLDAILKKHNL